MGSRDLGDRDAYAALSDRQRNTCPCCIRSRQERMEATDA